MVRKTLFVLIFLLTAGSAASAASITTEMIKNNDIQAIEQAIAAGADINAPIRIKDPGSAGTDPFEITDYPPLMVALKLNCLPAARKLIEQGADCTYSDPDNSESTLRIAVEMQSPETVKLLLEHGAKPDLTIPFLDLYSVYPDEEPANEYTELILNYATQEYIDIALLDAIHGGLVAVTALLIDRGADINKTDEATYIGFTPLMRAVHLQRYATAELLLQRGADIEKRTTRNFQGRKYQSALNIAQRNGDRKMITLLRKYGAKQGGGETILTTIRNFFETIYAWIMGLIMTIGLKLGWFKLEIL